MKSRTYSRYLNENKIIKWYSQNINFLHLNFLHLGCSSQWRHGNLNNLDIVMDKNNIKLIFIY